MDGAKDNGYWHASKLQKLCTTGVKEKYNKGYGAQNF